ncbi:uncharacterized protein [Clytia hemisphaerica]|uniref:TIR domain-containing protein n=1 Tax=Clytia hemisphaerica TaxID=252671 RepID=A0A7M5V4W8_9CNID|eukprot:TCONS_00003943-protein
MPPKHIMISYNWDIQDLVKKVVSGLKSRGIPVWMDLDAMSGDINSSMAEGVDGCKAIVCFMTQKYQDSKNCKRELTYADQQEKDIIPCMAQKDYKAQSWLGIVTAGLLWMNFRDDSQLETKIDSLAKEIISQTGSDWMKGVTGSTARPAVAESRPKDLEDKVSRAFKHCSTGQFLAESGQTKFHPASGNRNNLVLRNQAEATSFWVQERKGGKGEIIFFKNYSTNGYLGYDANGDYTYTKAQHYGAEEWTLKVDESDNTGKRAVVIFAVYGKKYLGIKNGKLSGFPSLNPACRWYLE